jgi:hypothetical protein
MQLLRGIFLVVLVLLGAASAKAETQATQLTLCRAGDSQLCPPGSITVGCATDVGATTKNLCGRTPYATILTVNRAGGQCGALVLSVTCTPPISEIINTWLSTFIGAAFGVTAIAYLFFSLRSSAKEIGFASRYLPVLTRLPNWVSIVGGLIGLLLAAWAALTYFSSHKVAGIFDLLISTAFAASDVDQSGVVRILPYIAALVIGLMAVSFLVALGTLLVLKDTKDNQARIKAADNIVKTFGGFFTGLATTILK